MTSAATSKWAKHSPVITNATVPRYLQTDANGVPLGGHVPKNEEITISGSASPTTAATAEWKSDAVRLDNSGGVMTLTLPADLSNLAGKTITFYTTDTRAHIIAFTSGALRGTLTSITLENVGYASVTLRFLNSTRFCVVSNVGTTTYA